MSVKSVEQAVVKDVKAVEKAAEAEVKVVFSSARSEVDRLVANARKEISNLVSHAVPLAGAYAIIAHTDLTKLETGITGAIAIGIGAIVNKLRSVKL